MSQYIQLLGTDTPNGFGGCCYYGPLDHPGLQASSSLPCPTSPGFPGPAAYQNLLQLPLETALARLEGSAKLNSEEHGSFTPEKVGPTHKNASSKGSVISASGSEGYLFFNCPEGTQRFSSEANIKLTKIKGFFFTRWGGRRQTPAAVQPALPCCSGSKHDAEVDGGRGRCGGSGGADLATGDAQSRVWATLTTAAASAGTAVMGLPGLLFTINDAGVQHINVFGPSSAQLALHAWLLKLAPNATPSCLSTPTGSARLTREEGVGRPRSVRGRAASMLGKAGVERFLVALRVSYFSYRPMTFRLLTPTLPPPLPALKKLTRRSSFGREKGDENEPQGQSFSSLSTLQKGMGAMAATRDEVFLLPPLLPTSTPSLDAHASEREKISASAEVPFIVAVLPLSSQSVLVAFRVSGSVTPHCISGAHARENTEQCREAVSPLDADEREDSRVEFLPDLSELVLGYAIVNAPPPVFDAGRARALGVLPGPKYAQLKQGIAVYTDARAAGVVNKKASRRAKRAEEETASPGGDSVEKAHPSAHAAGESGVHDRNTNNSNAGSTFSSPVSSKNTEAEPHQQQLPQLVEPHEVLVPTIASRHLYVSLVLDGNSATDVRVALERLLGACDGENVEEIGKLRDVQRQTQGLSRHADAVVPKTSGEGCGELIRTLRQWFPDLAYAPLSASSSPKVSDGTRKRKLRTVVVRHVVHVQPLSYFKLFNAELDSYEKPKGGLVPFSESTSHSPLMHESVYHKYLSSIFGSVHPSVRRSCSPMMSFTVADLVEGDVPATIGHSSGMLNNKSEITYTLAQNECTDGVTCCPLRPGPFTKHLFTSFIQKHFTAFPTALVHRYHLHSIAPGSFPVPAALSHSMSKADQNEDAGSSNTGAGAPQDGAQGLESPPPSDATLRPFWPYSFKLCCIPQHHSRPDPAALFPVTSRVAGLPPPPSKTSHGAAAAKATPASSPFSVPPPPSSFSSSSSLVAMGEAALGLPLGVFTDGGGGAHYIRYPDAPAAQALLSADFQAMIRRAGGAAALTRTGLNGEAFREGGGGTRGGLPPEEDAQAQRWDRDEGGGALGFLGTGSAVPSKYRNVSGAYLELHLPACCLGREPAWEARGPIDGFGFENEEGEPGEAAGMPLAARPPASDSDSSRQSRGVFILDFGEGSAGQLSQLLSSRRRRRAVDSNDHICPSDSSNSDSGAMKRPLSIRECFFNSSECDEDDIELACFVMDVELVFISHGHADHHLGLLSFLSLRHFYLECQKVKRQALWSQRSAHEFSPSMGKDFRKLLIVLPEEVYVFMKLAWFDLWPYYTWIEQECEFDIIPTMDGAGTLSDIAASGYVPGNIAVGSSRAPVSTAQDSVDMDKTPLTSDEASGQNEPRVKGSDFETSPLLAVNSALVAQPSVCEVTCLPRLEALLARWNGAISSHLGGPPVLQRGRWDAQVLKVDHPANAHALLLRFPSPSSSSDGVDGSRVLLFSGDTRPCPFLVDRCLAFCARVPDAGMAGPFICLHEATFGPGFEAEAISKKHSTLPEALEVGAQTRSAFIVLNHFSQRYPKLPGLTEGLSQEGATEGRCKRSRTGSRVDSQKTTPTLPVPLEKPFNGVKSGDCLVDAEEVARSEAPLFLSSPMQLPSQECDYTAHGATDRSRVPQGLQQHAVSNMCFAFDLMRLSFSDLRFGSVASCLPIFVRLLEEYESWGVGTTQRLREST